MTLRSICLLQFVMPHSNSCPIRIMGSVTHASYALSTEQFRIRVLFRLQNLYAKAVMLLCPYSKIPATSSWRSSMDDFTGRSRFRSAVMGHGASRKPSVTPTLSVRLR